MKTLSLDLMAKVNDGINRQWRALVWRALWTGFAGGVAVAFITVEIIYVLTHH